MQNILDSLQDLPINALLDDIVMHTDNGSVAIVNSETSSGKTLLIPTMLQLVTNDQVLVIEPRRLLAINAATTLVELSNGVLGEDIGYVIGMRGRDEEVCCDFDTNKIVFTTYGYALATMLIMSADVIILDEIHESGMDISICKALLKHRMASDNPPKRVVLLSATLNSADELDYWQDYNPRIFTGKPGKRFNCTKYWQPANSVGVAALELVRTGSTGVLVFVPGVGDIKETIDQLNAALSPEEAKFIEIASIHGRSEANDKYNALCAPEKHCAKILVGTNVLESGINIYWVDAGVSSGMHKESQVQRESGAIGLHLTPIPQTSLQQQIGRTNRFNNSRFVLCGKYNYGELPAKFTPEIVRLPLTSLYMHCTSIGVDPNELDFSPSLDLEKLQQARNTLIRLNFIEVDSIDGANFTGDGEFADELPVGLHTAAFLAHAKKINVLPEALPCAAVMEVNNIRKDQNFSHRLHTTSDLFDGTIALIRAMLCQAKDNQTTKYAEMQQLNVGIKIYKDALDVIRALEKVLHVEMLGGGYITMDENRRTTMFAKLRQCLLAASLENLGMSYPSSRGIKISFNGDTWNTYNPANSTTITNIDFNQGVLPITARLRNIVPRNGKVPFTIAENITIFEYADFVAFNQIRPNVFNIRHDNDSITISINDVIILRDQSMRRQRLAALNTFQIHPISPQPMVDKVRNNNKHAAKIEEIKQQSLPVITNTQVAKINKPITAKIKRPTITHNELAALATHFNKK